MFKKLIHRVRDSKVAPWVVALIIQLIGATCRINSRSLEVPGYITAFLHGDQIALIMGYYQIRLRMREHRIRVLISPSQDGIFAANVAKHLGIDAIFASSSHTEQGFAALRQMIREAKEGKNIGIPIDGPKGPFGVPKDGIIMIHQKSKAPIRCIKLELSRYWELKSWDRMRIPKPFSSIIIHCQGIDFNEQHSTSDTKSLVEALCNR